MKTNPNNEKLNPQLKEETPDNALLKGTPVKTNTKAKMEFYKKVQILRRERRMRQ